MQACNVQLAAIVARWTLFALLPKKQIQMIIFKTCSTYYRERENLSTKHFNRSFDRFVLYFNKCIVDTETRKKLCKYACMVVLFIKEFQHSKGPRNKSRGFKNIKSRSQKLKSRSWKFLRAAGLNNEGQTSNLSRGVWWHAPPENFEI